MTRTHLNLPQEMLDRVDALAGKKGRSKFARTAMGQLLDRLAPATPEHLAPPYFESDGSHEPRLSASGTAALIEVIRRKGFDQVQDMLGYDDPRDFLYMLLGHTDLPNQVVTTISQLLIHGTR